MKEDMPILIYMIIEWSGSLPKMWPAWIKLWYDTRNLFLFLRCYGERGIESQPIYAIYFVTWWLAFAFLKKNQNNYFFSVTSDKTIISIKPILNRTKNITSPPINLHI